MNRLAVLFGGLLGFAMLITVPGEAHAENRAPRKVSAYAPPLVYGPQVVAVNHIGAMTVTITAKPLGKTKVVGEVEYWESENKKTQKTFFGNVTIKVANVVGAVKVRMKSVSPLGSAVELSVTP